MEHLLNTFIEHYKRMPLWNPSIIKNSEKYDANILRNIFNCIDLTSLNTEDNRDKIEKFCNKVKEFNSHFSDMPNVAAVCVYPVFADIINRNLAETDVKKAVVSACFPSSQTFLDIKIEETKKAISMGANEIDIVISVGEFLSHNYKFVAEEIRALKNVAGNAILKVILETGLLCSPENIWNASIIAMDSGADFIKTSTGKTNISATPEAAWIMTNAIKAFYLQTGKKVGFKPAGGIVTVEDAMIYRSIVKETLGDSHLNNRLFRIGTSRLANNVLTEIESLKGANKIVSYF